MPAAPVRPGTPVPGGFLLGAAFVLVALNLRIFLAGIPPLEAAIGSDLGLSDAATGALTTAPLVCFGVLAPLAPRLLSRWSGERILGAGLVAIMAGCVLRVLDGPAALYAGTVVAGVAVAAGNVLMPALITSRFPGRTGLMTGLYATALNVAPAVVAGTIVPTAQALGGWRPALGVWAAPALIAAPVLWVAARRRRPPHPPAAAAAGAPPPLGSRLAREPRAWAVTAFMSLQALFFFFALAWLPAILRAGAGFSDAAAGAALSILTLVGIPTALAAPVIAARRHDQGAVCGVAALLMAGSAAGLLAWPAGGYLWAALYGLGQGTGIAVALTLFGLRSRSEAGAARLGGMAQGVGYLVAAVGPIAMGALHDAAGSWTLPLAIIAACGVPMALAGLAAGRPGAIGSA